MLFDVRTLQRDGWSVVAVVGDVDLATLPTLKQHTDGTAGERVALDLSGVDHLDPAALGVVIALQLRARRAGARFAVVCPPGRPQELLAETGLDRIVEVLDALGPAGPGAQPS